MIVAALIYALVFAAVNTKGYDILNHPWLTVLFSPVGIALFLMLLGCVFFGN